MVYDRDERRWTGYGKVIGLLLFSIEMSMIVFMVVAITYGSQLSTSPFDSFVVSGDLSNVVANTGGLE